MPGTEGIWDNADCAHLHYTGTKLDTGATLKETTIEPKNLMQSSFRGRKIGPYPRLGPDTTIRFSIDFWRSRIHVNL